MTVVQETPTERPDYVAGSLLRSFGSMNGRRASWGLGRTVVLTALTFGLAPLLMWPRLLRDLILEDRNRYLHLSDWMHTVTGDRAAKLDAAADRIRPHPVLSYLPAFVPLVVIACFAIVFLGPGLPPASVVGATWGYSRNLARVPQTTQLFCFWTGGLMLGYVMHWVQVLLHQVRVRDAVNEFNHLVAAEGLAPVPVKVNLGIRPMWLIAGMVGAAAGSAMWAVIAMISGAAQRRYAVVDLPATQSLVTHRVRQLLSRRRPAFFHAKPVTMGRRCPNDLCQAPLEKIANFCPRCGRQVGPALDEEA